VAFLALACFGGYGVAVDRHTSKPSRNAHSFWAYERGLPQPSLLAFESDAKTILQDAAKAAPGSQARQQALEQANPGGRGRNSLLSIAALEAGTGLLSRDRAHTAELLLGARPGGRLAGNPIEQRLAFTGCLPMMPTVHGPDAAQALLDLAKREPASEQRARDPCATSPVPRYASSDPLRRSGLRGLLASTQTLFPGGG